MFCPQCSAPVTPGSKVCAKCGNSLEGSTSPLTPAPSHPLTVAGNGLYAGFWRRFGGWVIDYLVMVIAFVLLDVIPLRLIHAAPQGFSGLWVLISYLVLPWLYYAGMESSASQATFGKMAVGIKVTDLEGRRVSFARASGRYFAHIITGFTLGIGYAMVVFTSKRQALHDTIAGTLVVLRDNSQEQIAAAGPAPAVSGLLIAVAIIGVLFFGPFGVGVLAAIAIPAYQDFVIRAQVAQGLNDAAPYKVAIAEAVASGLPLPALTTQRLRLAPAARSPFVESIEVDSGIIVITYGSRATAQIRGKRVLLIPGTAPNGSDLVWVCGRHPAPEGVMLPRAAADLGAYTTVPDRNLPTLCRGE